METTLTWYKYSERKPEKDSAYIIMGLDGHVFEYICALDAVEDIFVTKEKYFYWAEITTPVLGDVSGVEERV